MEARGVWSAAACRWQLLLLAGAAAFNLETHPELARIIADPNAQRGSYFGFTVGLRRDQLGTWVVVGAPRANSTHPAHASIHQPGVVYQCAVLGSKDCIRLSLDPTGNVEQRLGDGFDVKHHKDDMWLGGSLDVQQNGPGIVACGSRWINQFYTGYYLINGICYFLKDTQQADSKVQKIMPLIQRRDQGYEEIENGEKAIKYYYSYGQAGLAVQFAKNDTEIIIGAPGIYVWKGSAIIFRTEESDKSKYTKVAVPNPRHTPLLKEDSYFGYSLGTGKFYADTNEVFYVSGVPRGADCKGKIQIFSVKIDQERQKSELFIINEYEGKVMGEYFGAAISIVDLNSDGLDDILVGAPLHPPLDSGRVYVYINSLQGRFKEIGESHKIVGSGSSWSRFGSTISNLGDINMDGFPDIAVGAPYEDEGRGAVYVYMGSGTSKTGLRMPYSQRIAASELSPLLMGFGISISRGFDVDNNHYNDVAIGAYGSGHTIVLRSYPVITLLPQILAPKVISINDTSFNISACIGYRAQYPPPMARVRVKLHVTSSEGRAKFLTDESGMDTSVTFSAEVYPDKATCKPFTISVTTHVEEFYKPIDITMEFDLDKERKQRAILDYNDSFCKTCPTIDPDAPRKLLTTVHTANGCKNVENCITDLHLTAFLHNITDPITLGTAAAYNVSVDISVTNTMEPAFVTNVYVSLPPEVSLVRLPHKCQEDGTSPVLLTCSIGNLITGEMERLSLYLQIGDEAIGLESIAVNVTASSAGTESTPEDNIVVLQIPVVTAADVEVIGKSSHEQLLLTTNSSAVESDEALGKKRVFRHLFQVVNYGPSPVQDVGLEFHIPAQVKMKNSIITLLEIYKPKAYLDDEPLNCHHIGPLDFTSMETWDSGEPEGDFLGSGINVIQQRRRKRQVTLKEVEDLSTSVQSFNCSHRDVVCLQVYCTVDLLAPLTSRVLVTFTAKLTPIISWGPVLQEGGSLSITSSARIKIPTYVLSSGNRTDEAAATILLLASRPLRKVDTWIIIISAISGVLVLLLIILGLIKAGFFKRTKKEELDKLKEQSLISSDQMSES
ncbi:integrin alpha-PS4-like isoform X2 [Schistocerca gregaria]|uniref:integrin alpha-PS4-like isoform X2 n=1 Tax=Schistocerca gregaria TaxID=7010 RepID=UPI00211E9B28|nr:integrin alpha-PS4-like isoform X2 [Schistocerca gregaria]